MHPRDTTTTDREEHAARVQKRQARRRKRAEEEKALFNSAWAQDKHYAEGELSKHVGWVRMLATQVLHRTVFGASAVLTSTSRAPSGLIAPSFAQLQKLARAIGDEDVWPLSISSSVEAACALQQYYTRERIDEAELVGWTKVLGLPYRAVNLITRPEPATAAHFAACFHEEARRRNARRVRTRSEQQTRLLREGVESNPGPEMYQIFNPEHENSPR